MMRRLVVRTALAALMGLVSLLALVSCEYKDLCYDHNHWAHLRVAFNWVHDPAAQPKGMTVLFYNGDYETAMPTRYDLPGRDGGLVRLVPAVYRALAYNYDTETILYRNMDDVATLEAYTRQSSIEEGTQLSRSGMPRAVSTEEEPIILEPDTLWAAVSRPIELRMTGDTTVVTLEPTRRYVEMEVTIHNVPNLEYAGQFGGALSGLAPGVMMASGQLVDGRASQAFTCQVVDGNTLYMKFRIFGHCPRRDQGEVYPHLLTVYAILADGSKWYYTIDVTDQIHDENQNPDDYHIYIDLDGLPVPKPIVNGSGFKPTIDGWQGEEIEVKM